MYDVTVTDTTKNAQERKIQINQLEKTMRLIGEGPGAKTELAAFFTQLRSDQATYKEALERIVVLHWELHMKAEQVKKWFDLSKFINTRAVNASNATNPKPNPRGQISTNVPPSEDPKHTATTSNQDWVIKPIGIGNAPLKWTNPESITGLCQVCNKAHLHKSTRCSYADKTKFAGLANHENVPWKRSKIGKEWANLGYYTAMHHLPSWHAEQLAAGAVATSTDRKRKKGVA